ncbi:MAG: S-layer homology domain-containing protein [Clostridiales bacterium]|nr:S-layer homology domain-containing protein [Clostridiales bacterium]
MKRKQIPALLLSAAVALSGITCGAWAADDETDIVLSDQTVTVNGQTASTEETAAVYTGAEIVYYKDGTDSTYGEGTESEMHSAEEAAAHTVVTITRPGTYRLTGSLSAGQIAVDLGEDAKEDPAAVVTLILDNVDVTCTVAPALIFYNVYECGSDDPETASPVVDTSAAGANVIIAAGSENTFTGSHVARIYKEGTTKKLHKYDGAFYSKMSMNVDGDHGDDSGVLNIIADNEGMDAELHLTINGGTISITSQDDGINTNEDGVSVTTINGGSLTVNGGNGAEGDGIDSNGYLVINGGAVWTMANETSPDGGIDADQPILINGGSVYAFGTRNDAADSASEQPYMELAFASTLPAGSVVSLRDESGNELWSAVTRKKCQSITLSVPELKLDTTYHVYVDDVLQCYSGNSFGMGHGGLGGGRPEGMEGQFPDGENPPDRPGGQKGERPEPPEGMELPEGMEPPEGMELPEGFGGQRPEGGFPGGDSQADGSGSTDFVLTETTKSFSGVCDSDASGKIRVTFTVEGAVRSGKNTVIEVITAVTPSVELDPALVQISVTDDPSEDYAASCLLSDGLDAVNALLPTEDGNYTLTAAVVSGNEDYTGATQISFTVGALPFTDVRETDEGYEAIRTLYRAGAVNGVGNNRFSPDGVVTRAQAITVLARLAGAEQKETGTFSDVEAGSWYSGYVGWAVDSGIVEGDGQGRFLPDEPVTAGEMALMLERYQAGYEDTLGFDGPLTRSQMAQMVSASIQ